MSLCGSSAFLPPFDPTTDAFSPCFLHVVFGAAPALVLLLLATLALVCLPRSSRRLLLRHHLPRSTASAVQTCLRAAVSIALLGVAVAALVQQLFSGVGDAFSVVYITNGVRASAWLAIACLDALRWQWRCRQAAFPWYLGVAIVLATGAQTVMLYAAITDPAQANALGYAVGTLALLLLLVPLAITRRLVWPTERTSMLDVRTDANDDDDATSVLLPSSLAASPPLLPEEDDASWLSALTFHWTQPMMRLAHRRGRLEHEDLVALPRRLHTASIAASFRHLLRRDSLVKALLSAFGRSYFPLGILKFLCDALGFAGPLLLNLLVSYVDNATEPLWHGLVYAAGLFLSTLLTAILNSQYTFHVNVVGLQARVALMTSIYRKALYVNAGKRTTGDIVNYMSTDTDRVVNFFPSFHAFWSLPFQIAVSLYLLYTQVGLAFVAGVAFAVALIPINKWIASRIGVYSERMMKHKDLRLRLVDELFHGIRVIKQLAWERVFMRKIQAVRQEELAALAGRKYLDALCVFFWASTPVLISLLTFVTYASLGHSLSAAKVFTSLSLFNMLIAPLNAFPWVLNGLVESWVSIKRLRLFLNEPEIDPDTFYRKEFASAQSKQEDRIEPAVCLVGINLAWPTAAPEATDDNDDAKAGSSVTQTTEGPHTVLRRVTLNVARGSLVGICGRVGSGKSTLLSALACAGPATTATSGGVDPLTVNSGDVYLPSRVLGLGYVPQKAWLQNMTVRENILFGRVFRADWYSRVTRACALETDFAQWSAGDETEIGEDGVNLSGGQRARVALARACYQDADVYLLDDPFSAVDATVGRHLMDECLRGLLRSKTVIVATHHVSFLLQADAVVCVDPLAQENIATHSLEQNLSFQELLRASEGNGEERSHFREGVPKEERKGDDATTRTNIDSKDKLPLASSLSSSSLPLAAKDGRLTTTETRETGAVRRSVYVRYLLAIGTVLGPLVLVSLALMQASRNGSDWWLSYWVGHEQSLSVQKGLHVYAALGGACALLTLARAFLFAAGGLRAARRVHEQLLDAVVGGTVAFFDATPVGRIVNRFSSDVYAVDDSLPFIANILLAQSFSIAGTIVVTCYGLPYFVAVLVPLAVVYWYLQRYYRNGSREIKRLDSTSRSPIYAHFSESVSGAASVRAFAAVPRFVADNEQRVDINQRASYGSQAASQWLNMRLQAIGVVMVTAIALLAVGAHHVRAAEAGLVGLALTYALGITGLLSGVVNTFTETEKELVSVERIAEYCATIEREEVGEVEAPEQENWPAQGALAFHNVSLRYRAGQPLALDGVTFCVSAGERVGVVGRTGAGKSSLFSVLLRCVDVSEGQCVVDGLDLTRVPLSVLRNRIGVVPQEPVLFTGTVRDNVDPDRAYSRERVAHALEACHIAEELKRRTSVKAGAGADDWLESVVETGGRNFSVGQRQLVCLARAVLRNTRVLLVDEATASVDAETDRLMQQCLRLEFAQCTVLTIAHRVSTVLDSDRVLVLSRGRVVEFDTPDRLLSNESGVFTGIVNEGVN